jgi:hypothetical protein
LVCAWKLICMALMKCAWNLTCMAFWDVLGN